MKEASHQIRAAADVSHALAQSLAKFRHARGRVVGHDTAVEVTPEIFDGVELRCVRRQPLQRKPAFCTGCLHMGKCLAALVGREAVPQQDHPSWEFSVQSLQEPDDIVADDGACFEAEPQPDRAALGAGGQSGCCGESLPIEVMDQAGCLPARSPGAAHGRFLRKAAFIHEDQPRANPLGFFLMAGQTLAFQC